METTVVDILRPLVQEIEKQSEERKFLAAILSVPVVICNENVISEEDFARATPEDAALVEKLKEILKLNKHSTTECFRVVKLTCQMVIAMIQVSMINEHNFQEELDEALETMSEIDECMLFAGNDRDEVIKPARSLVSLVKEAQELLNTQHNNILTDISA
jgi:predicted histidine transporter YuiF (NhaC family)